MPRYAVTVSYTLKYEKELTIHAPSEEVAEEKAVDIVLGWNNVDDADAISVEEMD